MRGVQWLKLSDQKTHDSQVLPDLEQLIGSLFLFDLGYFSQIVTIQRKKHKSSKKDLTGFFRESLKNNLV
jgi:hypothetical protein